MMKKSSIIANVLVISGLLYYIWLINSPRGMILVAQGDVPVYSTVENAEAWPHPTGIYTLHFNQNVQVLRCSYGKDYRIIKVRLADNREGFVIDGDYILLRNNEPTNC